MTVDRMRQEMPNAEFVLWHMYYERKAQRAQDAANRSRR